MWHELYVFYDENTQKSGKSVPQQRVFDDSYTQMTERFTQQIPKVKKVYFKITSWRQRTLNNGA